MNDDKIKQEFLEERGREARREFVRDVQGAIGRAPEVTNAAAAHVFTKREQADTLRRMADQLEKDAAGDPVKRTRARIQERDGFPNRGFFQPVPAKPSAEMRDRWLADAKGRPSMKRLPARDRDREPER